MSRLLQPIFLVLLCLTSLAGCTGSPASTPACNPNESVILDYELMPYEQIIDNSDAIFVGRILSVSCTSWNQDSGNYWDGGLPVYTMEVQLLQPIVDTLGLSEQVTITQVGYSPLDTERANALVVGQQAVVFVVETDIAWRDGLRRVLRTTNADTDSVIAIGDNSDPAQIDDEAVRLEGIIQGIAERRDTLLPPKVPTPN